MSKRFAVLLACLLFAAAGYAEPCTNVGPESACLTTVVPEQAYFANGVQNPSNWEMYSGAFVDGTLASVTNTEAEGDLAGATERAVAIWYHTDNSPGQEVAGFLKDNGGPWTENNDIVRTDGNMPRIGPQVIAGEEDNDIYLFGSECTPWAYPDDFPSYGSGFAYDAQVASVQILRRGADGNPIKVTNVFDPTYGSWTTGAQTNQIRFGGSLRMLSNGNFIVVVEDRSAQLRDLLYPGRTGSIAAASLWSPAGVNIPNVTGAAWPLQTPGYTPNDFDGTWDSLDAYNGGFAVRFEGSSVTFFNNDGSWAGRWVADTRASGEAWQPWPGGSALWNTSIGASGWSGSNERVSSHVALKYVHVVGRGRDAMGTVTNGGVFVTRIDATTFQTIGEAFVSEGIDAAPDRCESCTDKYGNVFVCWSDPTNTRTRQILGRLYDRNLDPLTDCFLVFKNSQVGPSNPTGFGGYHTSCHMVYNPQDSTLRILVSQRTDSYAPSLGLNTNDHYAIVFDYGIGPAVPEWELY